MKRRNELKMKPAAVMHMLSPRNFKIGSSTRSPHVGGLAAVSRHLAVVHGGFSIYICVCVYIYIYMLIINGAVKEPVPKKTTKYGTP